MSTVYLGIDSKIQRKVAIKTIALADEFDDVELSKAREQFLREAESAGRLNHPDIIAIYDIGEDQRVAYLAMEYFSGTPLIDYADRKHLLPPVRVLQLMARAAEALDYAHSQNVVHRDVKPANILYDAATDRLKITDFGIARLTDTSRTKTGVILGTPSYMSPEQLSASGVTGQSDLYSLGVTVYHLLTGAPPFRADSIPQLMDKIIHDNPTPVTKVRAELPDCLNTLINKALAKDPQDRFPNGKAMALALLACSKQVQI
jgi:serine/threonine-protein kinase